MDVDGQQHHFGVQLLPEVDQRHFHVHLLPILRHIANADFVAFDLEMSGIGTSPKRPSKPSIQEVYEDVKAAAETYQVLQVGITCVEKDEANGTYVARPFNFNLSPLFLQGDRLGVERKFSFSSSALHFLLGENVLFDIAAPFKTGVPYLSRDEEEYARHKYNNVIIHNDVSISPDDMDALTFYRNARQAIKQWHNPGDKKEKKLPYVNVQLNGRYGLRLIHQLVRTEFPELIARWMRDVDTMQITVRDDAREAKILEGRRQRFEHQIAEQIGLRYVFEALFGGDLSQMNPKWFCIDEEGRPQLKDIDFVRKEIADITESLKVRRPALVGHNLHGDLAFMYMTFIGLLPDTYQEFSSHIHSMCPIVIDTKYLATHNCGSMGTKSDLQGLLEECDKQPKPHVRLAQKHMLYGSKVHRSHEAGYDSWMTAQVLIKRAAKMKADQAFNGNTKENKRKPMYIPPSPASSIDSSTDGGVSLLDLDNDAFDWLMGHHRRLSEEACAEVRKTKRTYLLGPGEEHEQYSQPGFSWEPNHGRSRSPDRPGQSKQWIPDFDEPFWNDYVNKLRVFQAEEGFYELKDHYGTP